MKTRAIFVAALAALLFPALVWAAPKDGSVLVFGGTGKLGSDIVKSLVAVGEDVTVFVREGSDRSALKGLDVDYVVGDLLDDASVGRAFDSKKFRAVVDASANRTGTGKDGGPDRDSRGFYSAIMKPMAKHAKRTGVQQFILHGSVLALQTTNCHLPAKDNFSKTLITASGRWCKRDML